MSDYLFLSHMIYIGSFSLKLGLTYTLYTVLNLPCLLFILHGRSIFNVNVFPCVKATSQATLFNFPDQFSVVKDMTARTGHGTIDWFQIGKGVCQGWILPPCLFNLYAEYIMWNARLDEAQARIKIARRNINNLRCADDTTVMAESKKELRASWWQWKRRVKKLA